jgi:hypothetical protein
MPTGWAAAGEKAESKRHSSREASDVAVFIKLLKIRQNLYLIIFYYF